MSEVLGDRELSVATARRAALLAAAGQTWESEVGPTLSGRQVGELMGDERDVLALLRERRIIATHDAAGDQRFPTFQFVDGEPLQPLADAFWKLVDAPTSEWTAVGWCVRADEALDGVSPAQWVRDGRDPGRVLSLAGQDAARLAR